ncbi:MAG TPA: hypothetical protein VGH28_33675 [Polyangiaceae bacterium]
MKFATIASVLLVACAAQPRLDPAIAAAPPTEPAAVPTVTVTPRACDAADARAVLADRDAHASARLRCAWTAVTPAHGAVIRTAMLDCGFRGAPPTPVALGGGRLAAVAHRPEGDFLLVDDGAVEALPRHDALVVTPRGPTTILHLGAATMLWSTSSCEVVDLPGALTSPFAADDGTVRGWIDGRTAKRAANGIWSIAEEDPALATLDARAPHAVRNGLDARVEDRADGDLFRIVAQRWGFAAIVVTQTEPHVQPTQISIAPPEHGAGPRAPVVLLRDGVHLAAGDNQSIMGRTGKLTLHVPDASRGYRELDVHVGEQQHDCSQSYDQVRAHPSRAESNYTDGIALARTADDVLWLVTRRHHEACTFVLDPEPEIESEGPRHPPPERMWRGELREESDEIVVAALDEKTGATGAALRVPVAASKPNGATWLVVGASGTNVLAVLGGFAVWIDTSKVSR